MTEPPEKRKRSVDDFLWGFALVFVLALSLLAIGPLFNALPKPSTIPTVSITCRRGTVDSCAFAPGSLTVQFGRSLLVSSQGPYGHTFTSRANVTALSEPIFHLELDGDDAEALHVVYDAGTYEYYCRFHSWMVGSITVA